MHRRSFSHVASPSWHILAQDDGSIRSLRETPGPGLPLDGGRLRVRGEIGDKAAPASVIGAEVVSGIEAESEAAFLAVIGMEGGVPGLGDREIPLAQRVEAPAAVKTGVQRVGHVPPQRLDMAASRIV